MPATMKKLESGTSRYEGLFYLASSKVTLRRSKTQQIYLFRRLGMCLFYDFDGIIAVYDIQL